MSRATLYSRLRCYQLSIFEKERKKKRKRDGYTETQRYERNRDGYKDGIR